MYGYIYLTTNTISGKKYIGKHKATEFDIAYKGSGVALRRAMDKYGWDAFHCELVESFDTREELNDAEIRYITEYNAVNSSDFYNIASGGEGGDTFSGMSDKDKEKFRESTSSRWKNPEYRNSLISSLKDRWKNTSYKEVVSSKISSALSDRPKTEEHKKALSYSCLAKGSHKGSRNGMYGKPRSGELAPNFGRHYYNNGELEYLLYEDVYELEYKDRGFVKGRLQCKLDALHKDLSKRLQGNTYNKGKVRIHKDELERCIHKEEIDKFLSEGWVRGRRPKQISQSSCKYYLKGNN